MDPATDTEDGMQSMPRIRHCCNDIWGSLGFSAIFDSPGEVQSSFQERLHAPFLIGMFSRGFSRGKTAHSGKRPIKVRNGPLRRGNAPLTLMGSFRAPCHGLGIRLALTRAEIPKIGKRGFRSQKTPISHHPRKGRSESKNPHFYTEHYKENGDFLTRSALFWGGGKWGFLTPKPSFPDFGDFGPCKGQTNS